ncbi:late competence development ComFB family protein [Piscinibacter sp. Jin2]|uniref:Late competence development ComFB family protein n=1 Tax=Aquariibacter lacus TaxID=2801332 RepID=A0A9X0XCK9_9BURK|nr:late competence development ComFB family protein [Piscinibacter lacus]MBL0718463.1 late competence development ComFB family protein [Piscinibacter lacus]
MNPSFESIHNIHEAAVIETVLALQGDYPAVAPDLLPDVACVALNRLPPRYIRHSVDLAFYQDEKEREELARLQQSTVRLAFEFVQARRAMRARV